VQREHPWRDGDVVKVSIFALLGLAAILAAAWLAARDSASLTHQVAWLNLGVAGLMIFGVGNCLWLVAVRGAVAERRASLVWLDSAPDYDFAREDLVGGNGTGQFELAATATWRLVRGAGMSRVHLPDCPLVAGKHVEPAGISDGEPCGVCLPS
jgi:hypothetical protein